MTPNPFDLACRYLLKLAAAALLRWLLRAPPGRYEFIEWLDARQVPWPGQPDRVCDTVAWMRDSHRGGEPWAVVVEFQIDPDELMFGRALRYLSDLWLMCKPSPHKGDRFQVGLAAVNLRGVGKASRNMAFEGTDIFTSLGVGDRNLSTYSARQVLAEVEAGEAPRAALAFVPLFQGGADPGIIQEWLRLAAQEADVELRRALALAEIFAEAAKCREVWREALKEWNVIESQVLKDWTAMAVAAAEKAATAAATKKALLQMAVQSLIRVLQTKFQSVPADIETPIRACSDVPKLERLIEQAVLATTLDDFRRALVE